MVLSAQGRRCSRWLPFRFEPASDLPPLLIVSKRKCEEAAIPA